MSRTRTALTLSLAALAAAFVLPGGTAQAAQAQAATVVCTGTANQTYSPPLGPLPKTTDVDLNENVTCLGGPFLTGTASASFVEQASCLIPPPMDTVLPAGNIVYHWSNGQTSTVTYGLPVVVRAANQTIVTTVGTITSGYSQGSLVEREVVTLDLDVLGCLTSSISKRPGSEILTVLL
ncbi:hypothetical protein [Streptomyces sp. NPDC047130]|uniref:hypothetical protein n=1 Tax=Streptomyces sp. NPDC047130 TaxID=3155261 RepID=UPI0033FDCE46